MNSYCNDGFKTPFKLVKITNLKKGDHVVVKMPGIVHHMVMIDKYNAIHLSPMNTPCLCMVQLARSMFLPTIHSKVISILFNTTFMTVISLKKINKHDVKKMRLVQYTNKTFTNKERQEIITRARYFIGRVWLYNLFIANCESFVNYVIFGQLYSQQVYDLLMPVRRALHLQFHKNRQHENIISERGCVCESSCHSSLLSTKKWCFIDNDKCNINTIWDYCTPNDNEQDEQDDISTDDISTDDEQY